jgi:hypothetical protein
MKRAAAILRRVRRRDGQVLPLVAGSMVVLIGFAALVFDIGRVYVAQQSLQAAVNSAALAAGQDLPNAYNAYTAGMSYGGAAGEKNAVGGYEVTAGSPTVTFECLSHAPPYPTGSPPTCPADTATQDTSTPCQPTGALTPSPTGATGCNAVNVTEKTTVQTTLGGVLHLPSFTVSASATAAQRGETAHPVNVYVILDNTRSMSDDCTATVPGITANTLKAEPDKLDCAKAGTQALLNELDPCDPALTSCPTTYTKNSTATPPTELGANVAAPVDEVGLMVIPAITGNPPSPAILGDEINCNSASTFGVEYPPWSDPTTPSLLSGDAYLGYEAVGLSSDYRTADASTATIASTWTTSNVVEALDWGECSPQSYPAGTGTNPDGYGLKDIGGVGSYLAGAITEAQYQLQQHARTGTTSMIVIESDGELNPSTTFSNGTKSTTACTDAYNAAAEAKTTPVNSALGDTAGDTIYTIEYDSDSICGPDTGAGAVATYDNADTLMLDMASSSSDYYDVTGAGDLTLAFQQVGDSLSTSTLIPVCTQPLPAC